MRTATDSTIPGDDTCGISEAPLPGLPNPETDAEDTCSRFNSAVEHRYLERRQSIRVPKSLGISVQPLDKDMRPCEAGFFAITQDISRHGVGYLSPSKADFEMAIIALKDSPERSVLCRICNSTLIRETDQEAVYLTNVEFLCEKYM